MEDRWYNFLDKIDKHVSVYPIIDTVDSVVPSFILFLVILFLILVLLLFGLMSSIFAMTYVEATVIVTSSNLPITGAEVQMLAMCSEKDLEATEVTDGTGKALLELCESEGGRYKVTVVKNGFETHSSVVQLDEENIVRINLSAIVQETRTIYGKVINEENQYVQGASIELICLADSNKQETTSSASGDFSFETFEGCSTTQLRANAEGYETGVKSLGVNDTRVEIVLQKSKVNGKVFFEIDYNGSSLRGAEVVVIDEQGRTKTRFSDASGTAEFEDMSPQTYQYTVFNESTGSSKQDSFELSPKKTKTIEVSLEFVDQSTLDTKKRIRVLVVDESDNPIANVSSIIFRDGNVYTNSKVTDAKGEINIVPPSETSSYVISLKKTGYMLNMSNIVLKTNSEEPQKIVLKQGGATLKVKVVNEDSLPVSGANVELYLQSFTFGYLDSSGTDSNGEVIFNNLPAGNYNAKAKKTDSDGEGTISLSETDSKELVITMVIGTGILGFQTKDVLGKSLNIKNYEIEAKRDSGYIVVKEGDSLRYYYATDKEKHGTKIVTSINDSNYFPYESFEYSIYKANTASKKDIFMVTPNDLPNNNKVQMMLQQVYSTNPLQVGTPKSTEKIEAGKRYYLLFAVILNPEEQESHDLLTNFVVGPMDRNSLIENNPFKIQDAISLRNTVSVLSPTHNGFEINYLDSSTIVSENAKQANTRTSAVGGPKMVPVLVTIDVDGNAQGKTGIEFNAKWGNEKSLDYYKEFEIGKTFCMGKDCPTFLFSNYIKWNNAGEDYSPITDEEIPKLYIGDNYSLKTIVENITPENIGELQLLISQNSSTDRVLLDNNSDTNKSLSLGPLEESDPLETRVDAISSASSLKIKQFITKIVGANNLLESYEGTENEFRVKVLSKDRIKIETNPKKIYAGAEYPMFVIKLTNDTQKEALEGYWRVEQENGTTFNEITGTTDANGIAIIQIDATNLEKGDKLLFTGYSSGMIDASITIEVDDRMIIETPSIMECLSVDKESLSLAVGGTGTINIISDCNEDRLVYLHTDQHVSQKQFTVSSGETKPISVTGTAKNNIIGAYPLQVLSINGSRYSQVAFVDVIVSDSSCFGIDTPIIDLTRSETHSGVITNNCFSGRRDNFYPKVEITTNSVSLSYNKPGNPSEFTFTPVVTGHAIEAAIYCFMWSNIMGQSTKGDGCGASINDSVPEEALYAEQMNTTCEAEIEGLLAMQQDYTEKQEPEISMDDYVKEILRNTTDGEPSEVVGEEGSTATVIPDANFSSTQESKTFYFEETEGCGGGSEPIVNPRKEDEFSFYPTPIGDATAEPGCHEKEHLMPWVAAPHPPEWGSCDYGECWLGGFEAPSGPGQVLIAKNNPTTKIVALGAAGEEISGGIKGILYTEGQDCDFYDSCWWSFDDWFCKMTIGWIDPMAGLFGESVCGDPERSSLFIQPEFIRAVTFLQEQKEVWTEEVTMGTSEGVVYDLGRYDATPTPKWTNETTAHGLEAGESEAREDTLVTSGGAQGIGFVPPEYGTGEEGNYEVESQESQYIEYDSTGMIKYKLDESTVPDGVEAFIYGGKLYAVYNGVPQISGPNIAIDITNKGLMGTEYALIVVQDWTGNKVEEKYIQVKLVGPPSNCYLTDGTSGFTGSEYSPRLLFNWDWASVPYNQCDYENSNYTYCDSTQFTMELFRKIKMIGDYFATHNETQIGPISSFYAYLIKDNYSENFLEDFDEYYSQSFSDTPTWFNSAGGASGYDKFITENKITISGGDLPYGGLYQVSIEVVKEDQSKSEIISGSGTNATIRVRFIPYRRAPNYNPFYETPFDGEVSANGTRTNYGTSVSGPELKLNSSTKTATYNNSLKDVSHETSNALSALNSGVILTYNTDSGTIQFNPAQPTPVVMKVDGSSSGRVTAGYVVSGNGASASPNKTWKLIGSTMGTGTCIDFENQSRAIYTDGGEGATKKIIWNGNTKGTLELATTFFTPPASNNSIAPFGGSTLLRSKSSLVNAETILLNNFDSMGEMNYDTLQKLFNMVNEEKVCMSQNSEEELKIWWNPEYLERELQLVETVTPSCN